MGKVIAALLFSSLAFAQYTPPASGGGGGGAPSGPAGGVLSGTYPNPGFAPFPVFTGTLGLNNSAGSAPLFAITSNAASGDPSTFTAARSGFTILDSVGGEIFRVWASLPDVTGGPNLGYCLNFFNCLNLYIGYQAGFNQPSDNVSAGYRNMGIGTQTLFSITEGFDNYAIGTQALYSLTTGSDNQAWGFQALYASVTGENNTALGNGALHDALGDENTATGAQAGQFLTTGNSNSFYGFAAKAIGAFSNVTVLGARAVATASNRVVIGDANVTGVFLGSESAAAPVHALGYRTATNCADSAGAAACGSAAAGSVVIDAGATSVVVSTTAVTANSEIMPVFDSSLGTRLGVTCNVTIALPVITARTVGTSFTIAIAVAPITNPACFSYSVIN